MVKNIINCASYKRGRNFILECDHQSLKPLFQKILIGAIYERWLAILKQFNFEIKYKNVRIWLYLMHFLDAMSKKTLPFLALRKRIHFSHLSLNTQEI